MSKGIWKNKTLEQRTVIGSQMAKVRWSKTSKEERLAHSLKMTEALKAKRKVYEKEMQD
jgi:hypothetical protein